MESMPEHKWWQKRLYQERPSTTLSVVVASELLPPNWITP
jgi:hypothetical protein